MSTPAATARYVIAADDKTKAAVASAIAGFKGMERSAKATVSRINMAFGLIAGIGLKRAFQNIFTETAKESKEFAFALDDVRRSARGLLAAKEGAPAAAAAMRELAAVLKDPEFVAAADKISSMFIRGFVGVVKFTTGLKTLREEIDALKKQRDELAKNPGTQARTYIKGEPTFTPTSGRIYGLSREIEAKERELREREADEARRRAETWDRAMAGGERATRRNSTMREFEANIKYLEGLDGLGDIGGSRFRSVVNREDRGAFEQIVREADVAGTKARESFFDQMDEGARDIEETLSRTGDSIEEIGDRLGEHVEAAKESSVFVEEMQRSIFGNVSDLLASAGDGADEFGHRMISAFRRILADRATLALFEALANLGKDMTGKGGLSGAIGAGLSALFGGGKASGGPLAQGKWYIAGERGPEPIWGGGPGAFATGYGRGSGGGNITFAPTYNVDARGATQDAIRALPEILRRNNEAVKTDIIEGIRRNRYRVTSG